MNMKSNNIFKVTLAIIIILTVAISGCCGNDTPKEDTWQANNLITGASQNDYDYFQAGVADTKNKGIGDWESHNKKIIDSVLQCHPCDSLYELCGNPPIYFCKFHFSDAISDGYGIGFNLSKGYTRPEIERIIKYQLGVVYAFKDRDNK
jgi:hypothetical protein